MKESYKSLENIYEKFNFLYGESNSFQKERYNEVFNKFCSYFSVDNAYVCSSSGRVELLGNHADHNGGRVLSTAISLDTIAFFLPTNNDIITIYSEGYGEIKVDLSCYQNNKEATPKGLISGVADYYKNHDKKIGGFIAYCSSNVIGGAGISSSASFEVLIAEIFNFLYNDSKVTCEEKALASWHAENVFFGKPCGKLDQTAISFGGVNLLDFSCEDKIIVKPIDNVLLDYELFLINTGGSHENLTDEYASIPLEMKQVAKYFNKNKLIEVPEEEFFDNLNSLISEISDRPISRAIHFYQENSRVDNAYISLINKDYDTFLNYVNKSGESSVIKLQNCMVSGSEHQPIIKTLSILSQIKECLACRVHGGGFAGCVLAITKKADSSIFKKKVDKIFGYKNVISLKVRSVGTIVL